MLDDLNHLEKWNPIVKELQRGWIGRSTGAQIKFQLKFKKDGLRERDIEIYTTRPDTIFGVSFVAIAPDSSLA